MDYKECKSCTEALTKYDNYNPVAQLVDMRTGERLTHPNLHFSKLINFIEQFFQKNARSVALFDLTVDEVLEKYSFTFP